MTRPAFSRTSRFTLLGLALAGSLGVAASLAHGGSIPQDPAAPVSPILGGAASVALAGNPGLISDVAERALPSVVSVTNKRFADPRQQQLDFFGSPFFRRHWGEGFPGFEDDGDEEEEDDSSDAPKTRREQRIEELREHGQRPLAAGEGSGVIVDKNGTIVTNFHVVRGADELEVRLSDGRTFQAKVKGKDRDSDIAVLQILDPPKDLVPMAWGDSQKLRLGEVVLAIGNPFRLQGTVTMGIVSAKGRADVAINEYNDFIQTDAAINPGNSGGALVDLSGRLVGINSAIFSRSGGYQGIGFAIPSHMAKPIMEDLLDDGRVARGWLGVAIQDVTDDVAEAFKSPSRDGALVSDVTEDSPAAKAGVTRGDIIVSVDGTKVRSPAELRNAVATRGSGRKVELAILRDGKEKKLQATLGDLEKGRKVAQGGGPTATGADDGLLGGLQVGPLDERGRKLSQAPDSLKEGVVVGSIAPGSPAAASNLEPGDVIVEIDRQPVRNVEDFTRLYKPEAKGVLLLVRRQGGTLYLMLRK